MEPLPSFPRDADFRKDLLALGGLRGVIDETAVAGDLNVGFAAGTPRLEGRWCWTNCRWSLSPP